MSSVDFENAYPGWETTKLIGRGSFGAVYEIQRDNFGNKEKAALKVISIPQNDSDIEMLRDDGIDEESISTRYKGFLEDIVREYSLMAQIKGHSNTVYVDDVKYVQHDDGIGWDVFIKMELLTPLTKKLGKEMVIPDEEVLKVGSDMSSILSYCEEKKIIHRDIKPQNIFVSEDGIYKLGDFGIAKTTERTTSGTKTGTYNYMAPEVYNNQPYGSKADIYSLGLTLYWLLNERRAPFLPLPPATSKVSDEEKARARRFQGDQIPAPAHGSEELKTLVLRACAFDPKERYQNAAELQEDFENIKNGRPLSPATQAFAERLKMEQEEESDGDATAGVLLKGKGKDSGEGTVGVLHKIPDKGSGNTSLPVSVIAKIVWEKDKESQRPKAVSVVLMDGKNALGSAELNEENDWSYTWQNLNPSGNYAVYQQEIPKGYKAAAKGSRTNNEITITTTNTAKKSLLIPLLIAAGALLLLLGLAALLILLGRMQIVRQPESVKVNSGTVAQFQVETKGRISQIKWQFSPDGGTTWRDVDDSNDRSLQFTASPEQDGNLYRCVLMQGSKSLTSDAAELEVIYVTIPDVLGKNADEAKAILKEAGLVVTVNEEYNDTTPESVVFRQEPDAGGNVDPGTSVSITVSLGKETFSVESVSLDREKLALGVGESAQLQAFIDPENASNQEVSWSSSDEKVATVSADGEVNALAAGTAVIEVKTKDGGKTATCEVTVTEVAPEKIDVTGVKLNKSELSLTVGAKYNLKATVSPEDATDPSVKWSSSDKSVATVSKSGKVTAVAPGTATITVKTNDGSKTAKCKVTVKAKKVSVEGVTLNKTSLELIVGGSETLTATVTPANATDPSVTWSSSNDGVATVSDGKITAKAEGTVEISVITKDGSKKATCKVTIKNPPPATVSVSGVSLSPTNLNLTVGQSGTLTATVSPSNATNKAVTWSSSNTGVATVDGSGRVTAKAAGSVNITVKTADGGKTATCTVTVVPATVSVTGVSLNKTSLKLEVGKSSTLTADVSPSSATNKSVTWSSSDNSIATVDSSGKVTGKAAGTATITVKTADGGKAATCNVTVVIPVTGVTLNKTSLRLEVGKSSTLTADVAPSNATNKSVKWSSSDNNIATVDGNGKVTAKAVGNVEISVETVDKGKTAACSVTVVPATVSVTGVSLNTTSLTLENGCSGTLYATVAPTDAADKSVTWSSSDPSIVTVDSNGNVTGRTEGGEATAYITVTTHDGGYQATCTVHVLASWVPYDVVYYSSNGTYLGSSTETYRLGTTNPISAPYKKGYKTPSPQTVAWDTTDLKTITFIYEPGDHVSTSVSENLWYDQASAGAKRVDYKYVIETRNRTANSVECRIVCTLTKPSGCYYAYTVELVITANGKQLLWNLDPDHPERFHVCNNRALADKAAATVNNSTSWFTVTNLNPTDTTFPMKLYTFIYDKSDESTLNLSIAIPAY